VYAPHTDAEIAEMLAVVGAASLEDLVRPPASVAPRGALRLEPQAERDLVRSFEALAARNLGVGRPSFLGMGAYRHYVPPVLGALAMRGEFLTAYTPYQAEVSQGYLQAIYEWQTYVALLTGLDLANASVYDGATALAEAAIMAIDATGRRTILVARAVNPLYREVLATYARGLDFALEELAVGASGTTTYDGLDARLAAGGVAAVVVQSPNVFGCIDELPPSARASLEADGALVVAVTAEALSLAVLRPPAAWGATIAVGEAQSFGVALAYGGPHVGYIATTTAQMRRIPGRLVGRTRDRDGRIAYVLTLQAREQHIRRERATSNICTNQAHCALLATIYLAAMGRTGLRDCATANLRAIREVAGRVAALPGFARAFSAPVFNEVAIRVPAGQTARDVLASLEVDGVLGGVDLGRWYPERADVLLIAATEMTAEDEVEALIAALRRASERSRAATAATGVAEVVRA